MMRVAMLMALGSSLLAGSPADLATEAECEKACWHMYRIAFDEIMTKKLNEDPETRDLPAATRLEMQNSKWENFKKDMKAEADGCIKDCAGEATPQGVKWLIDAKNKTDIMKCEGQ